MYNSTTYVSLFLKLQMRHNLKILIHILGGPLTNVCSESCPFCSWSFVRCWLADTQAGGIQAVCESVGKTMRSVKK